MQILSVLPVTVMCVLRRRAVTNTALLGLLTMFSHKKERYVEAMEKSNGTNSIAAIVSLIDDAAKRTRMIYCQ